MLGTPAQRQVLDEHHRRLVEAARKHGKAVAMLTDSVEGVRQMIALSQSRSSRRQVSRWARDSAEKLDTSARRA